MIEMNPMLRAEIFVEHETGIVPAALQSAVAPVSEVELSGLSDWMLKTSTAVVALAAWVEALP